MYKLPNQFANTKRHYVVTVIDDINGEQHFFGFRAAVIQHECDHMDGVLFTDESVRDRSESITAKPKIGGNKPCPCGSGKKYKKCHG